MGDYFAKRGDAAKAAQYFEEGFEKGPDAVQAANHAPWLVRHYFTQGTHAASGLEGYPLSRSQRGSAAAPVRGGVRHLPGHAVGLMNATSGSMVLLGSLAATGVTEPVRQVTTLEVIVRLAAIAVLGAYLVSRHRRRAMNTPLPAEDPAVWTGHGIDTRTLRPRVDAARGDYGAAARPQPPRPENRRQRAWARRVVSCLAYFRDRHAHDDTEHRFAPEAPARAGGPVNQPHSGQDRELPSD